MRNCTLIEVLRSVRRVVTCAERNTDARCTPEKIAVPEKAGEHSLIWSRVARHRTSIVITSRRKWFRGDSAAMAGSASDWHSRVFDLAYVIRIVVFEHRVHHPRRCLLGFRVVGIVESRLAVWPQVSGVAHVASTAIGSELFFPLMHDFAHLRAGQVFWQNLKVGRQRVCLYRRGASVCILSWLRGCGEVAQLHCDCCGNTQRH